jgi:O-antigen/teichoic acid export membrane protein
MYLVKYMSPEILGIFFFNLSIFSIVFIAGNTYGDRFIMVADEGKEKERLNFIFTLEVVLYFIIGIVLLFLCSGWVNSVHFNVPVGLGIGLFIYQFTIPMSRSRILLEKRLNFRPIVAISISSTLFCNILGILLARWFPKNYLAPLLVFCGPVFMQAVLINITLRFPARISWCKPDVRQFISLCVPLMLAGLLVVLYWNADKIIVGRFCSMEDVGLYGWAFSLGVLVMNMKNVLTRVFFPVFCRLKNKNNETEFRAAVFLLVRSIALLYSFSLPLVLYLVPWIMLFVNKDWNQAESILMLALLIFSIKAFTSILDPVFVSLNKSRYLLIMSIFNTVIICGGGGVLVWLYPSVYVMAGVVLFSVSVVFIYGLFTLTSVFKIPLYGPVIYIASSGIIAFTLMVICRNIVYPGTWYGAGAGVLCGYGVLVLLLQSHVKKTVKALRTDMKNHSYA